MDNYDWLPGPQNAIEWFWPETLAEFQERMSRPGPLEPFSWDIHYPPGDPRRYGAQPDRDGAEHG